MDRTWKELLWPQLGAAIDMLENAVLACSDEPWSDRSQQPEYWYVVYHTLFFLDLSLSGTVEGFAPPAPLNLDELDPAAILPERPYTKGELLAYLEHGRRKAQATLDALTDQKARQRAGFDWLDLDLAELVLYNLRHVQHHAAQLCSLSSGTCTGVDASCPDEAGYVQCGSTYFACPTCEPIGKDCEILDGMSEVQRQLKVIARELNDVADGLFPH